MARTWLLQAGFLALSVWISGDAGAAPAFTIGGLPDLPVTSPAVTFDTGEGQQGQVVGGQFADHGAVFQNFTFDDGTLGQDLAPGFSGGGLVSGIATDPAGNLVITFVQPVIAADFAYASVGGARTLSAYFGGQGGVLVDSTAVQLPAAQSLAVYEAEQPLAIARLKVLGDQATLQSDQINLGHIDNTINLDNGLVTLAHQEIAAANAAVATDEANIQACAGNSACVVLASIQLGEDETALASANSDLSSANGRLNLDTLTQTLDNEIVTQDNATLSDDQSTESADQAAVDAAELLPEGPGFISFEGAVFDTLVLSDASIPTAIDDVQFQDAAVLPPPPPQQTSDPVDTPEPAGAAALGAILLARLRPRRA